MDEPEPEPIKSPDEPEGKPANEYEAVVSDLLFKLKSVDSSLGQGNVLVLRAGKASKISAQNKYGQEI